MIAKTPIEKFHLAFPDAKLSGEWFVTQCTNPSHPDQHASFAFREAPSGGKVMATCYACGNLEAALNAVGLHKRDMYPDGKHKLRGEGSNPPRTRATTQPPKGRTGSVQKDTETSAPDSTGCTLATYADAKGLPISFLQSLGVSQITYMSAPTIRIPYYDENGQEAAIRFRISLQGDNRFRWKSGAKPTLYGRARLEDARMAGYVAVVEGESDCHTLWYHGIPAVGLPGASTFNDAWATFLNGIETLYVFVEPDQGGETVREKFARSCLKERVRFISLADHKDISALYLNNPNGFREAFDVAIKSAIPLAESEAQEAKQATQEAWCKCEALAHEDDILTCAADLLRRRGLSGEDRAIKILYLAVTSRFLNRPVSVVVKGPSSSGKSYLTESVLSLFPPTAFYALSSMSEKALAYSEEPLKHRFLVIYEAAGLASEFASYLIRSLLSEGRIRYETVEKTADGLQARFIEREGPTGLIVTTTAVHLHPENETRLLEIRTNDTKEQTREILLAIADESRTSPADDSILEQWQSLQEWLAGAEHGVTIPYAKFLAESIPPLAVRLRRDFTAVLNLIRSHATLHQATRKKDEQGRVIATVEDYAVVRELVCETIAQGLDAGVPATVRETVGAVQEIKAEQERSGKPGAISVTHVAMRLSLDKGSASRRVRVAMSGGWLINEETRRGRPAILRVGDPLPDDIMVLPLPERLCGCTDADGDIPPSPPVEASTLEKMMKAAKQAAKSLAMPDSGVEVSLPGDGRATICPRRYLLNVIDQSLDLCKQYGQEKWMFHADGPSLFADWKAIAEWWAAGGNL